MTTMSPFEGTCHCEGAEGVDCPTLNKSDKLLKEKHIVVVCIRKENVQNEQK
jgi:hypothetical protein